MQNTRNVRDAFASGTPRVVGDSQVGPDRVHTSSWSGDIVRLDSLCLGCCRLRRRYGELIRAEIAQTVTTPEEADEELQFLFSVLRD